MQAILDKVAALNERIRYKPEPPEMKLYPKLHWRLLASMLDVFAATVILVPILPRGTPDPAVLKMQQQLASPTADPKVIFAEFVEYFLNSGGMQKMLTEFVVQYLAAGIIVLAFWFYKSATPGKMLLRMEIVDKETLGKPTRHQFIVRYLAYLLSMLPLGMGLMTVLFTKQRQALHDKVAGTVVVFKHRKPKT